MYQQFRIAVYQDSDGSHFAVFDTPEDPSHFPEAKLLFEGKGDDMDCLEEIEEELRQKAREQGIEHVTNLDDGGFRVTND